MRSGWLHRLLLVLAAALLFWSVYSKLGPIPIFLAAWCLWVPLRKRREGTPVLAILILFSTLWILHQLRWVVYPLLGGILLAYWLAPLVDRLHRWRLPRSLAALVALLPLVAAALLALLILVPTLVGQVRALVEKAPSALQQIQIWLRPLLQSLGTETGEGQAWPDWAQQILQSWQKLLEPAASGVLVVGRGIGRFLQGFVAVLLAPMLAYYLLVDWKRFRSQTHSLVPARWRGTTGDLASDLQNVLQIYLRGQFLVAGIEALLFAIGFFLAGLPEALALGILAGLFSLVPVIGFYISTFVVALSALVSPDPLSALLKAGVVLLVMQLLESQVLVPRIQGKGLGLHPLAVLLGVLSFGVLFGIAGALLAVPLLAMIRIFWSRLRPTYERSAFYAGDSGATPPISEA